jgi:hypothetical protein
MTTAIRFPDHLSEQLIAVLITGPEIETCLDFWTGNQSGIEPFEQES